MFAGDAQTEVTVPATTRRGKRVVCRVRMQPLRQADRAIYGTLVLTEVSDPPEG